MRGSRVEPHTRLALDESDIRGSAGQGTARRTA